MTSPKETDQQRKVRKAEEDRVYHEFMTGGYPRAGRKKRVKLTQAQKDAAGTDFDYITYTEILHGPKGKPDDQT